MKFGGTIINFEGENTINILEIRENSSETNSEYLKNKLGKLKSFFGLAFPTLTEEEKSLLEEKIIECYKKKKITFDDESLYAEEKQKKKLLSNKRFKKSDEMPILEDLYNLIKKSESLRKLEILMKPYINGSLKFLNGYTNVDLSNKFIVADIYNIPEENLASVMFIITELFWDKIKSSRGCKKVIYLDEVWRLIGRNRETAEFIFKMFKTIRKYGGGVTAITQDINDFFTLEDGKYGGGILNNSSIKCIFQLEENDIKKLSENMVLSEKEIYKIQNQKRGTCLICAGQNHVEVDIVSSEEEHKCISTDRRDG